MQLLQFLFRTSHKMLVILSNCKEKRLPFPLLERATSCVLVSLLLLRLGLCILGHPSHAGHRVRSSARLPLSISLFGPVRPCVPLKTTSSIGPISVGLALPKRKAGPFLRSAAAIPAGVFAPCSAGSARISLAHGRILSKLRFGFSAPPVFPCANRLCFLGSVPSLGFGGARFARLRFSILDVPFGLFPCSHPAALFPMGFASMRPLRPKLPPSWGSMQISDLWILRFETHFHFRILAGFGIALCRLSGLGAIPLASGGRGIRAYSSGVHRFLAPLRPCPLFLPLPAEILRFAFRKKQVYGKRVPVAFFVWFLGVLRRVSAGTAPEAAIFPLCLCRSIVGFFRSSGCCVLRVFRASAPALPPIPASPEEFRFQGFLLIGRAASLALLLGLPPAVFSPSDDFFELPLSRSLYATHLLHPYQTHAVKALARSISGSRRHATAGDLGLFSIRHWKRPLSFFLSIL